jgi:hypothetical protein
VALTTYGDLKASVADWATRSDLTTQVPDFIGWAHQEICRRLRANVMLASADLTINAETINQPTGFVAFKRLYLDTTPRKKIATVSAETAMDMSVTHVTSTYPTAVAVEGTLLRFAPLFTGTATGKALYYKEPTALSADADTNVVLTKYPFLYLYGALEALFRYLEDDNNADRYGGQFGALIEDINGSAAADQMSGSLQSSVYAGSIV